MDEIYLKKFKNLVATCPRPQLTWSELAEADRIQANSDFVLLCGLVTDFLQLVSGDDVSAMLNDILSPRIKDELPALSNQGDNNGKKRLGKLNMLLQKSPPLKPWTSRSKSDSPIRIEIELTARRSLSYLSGGQVLPLLEEILYPNEQEIFCKRYRQAMIRLGEAMRNFHPKTKAILLLAVRQAGFSKEDLLELNWVFSPNLWKVVGSNFFNMDTSYSAEDLTFSSSPYASRPYHLSHSKSGIKFPTREETSKITMTTTKTVTKSRSKSQKKRSKHPFGVEFEDSSDKGNYSGNHVYLNNYFDGNSENSCSSADEDVEKNPMFPQLH